MARKTKAEKLIDEQVEAAFRKHGSGVQFDIMDLSKIMNAGKNAAQAGNSVDDAMVVAVKRYRQN